MSLLPQAPQSLKLRSPRKPNYSDYQGPADGDYVRYVQELMDWAEQEQARQRAQAARAAGRVPATDWGRSSAKPTTQPATQLSRRTQAPSMGAVAAHQPLQQLARWVQKTSAQLPAQLQSAREQALASSTSAQSTGKPLPAKSDPGMAAVHKAAPVVLMAVVALLVILGAAQLIPIAIVVFVGYHLTRSVRGAKAGEEKPSKKPQDNL